MEEVRSASSSLTASAPQLPSSGASSSTTQSPIQSEDQEDEVATQVSEDTNFYEAMRSPVEQASQQSIMRQQRQKLGLGPQLRPTEQHVRPNKELTMPSVLLGLQRPRDKIASRF